MGVAILLKISSVSELKLAKVLWLLAAFGILHGVHEWGHLLIEINQTHFSPLAVQYLTFANLMVTSASFAFLFQFGTDLIYLVIYPRPWIKTMPILFFWIWIILIIILSLNNSLLRVINDGEIMARYLIGFPGALLGGVALIYYSREIEKQLIKKTVGYNLKLGGVFLIFYGIYAGVIGPEGNFFPANIINKEAFLSVTSIPIEAARTICAIGINYFIVSSLEVFDIETKRKIEAEVVEKTREIRETKDLLENIIQGSMDGIITKDLYDDVISWNKGAEKILGYRPDEILGKNYGVIIPEDQHDTMKVVEKELKEKGFVQNLDLQLQDRSGKRIPVNITSSYIKDHLGKVRGVTCIVRDLSEKRKLENQLIQTDKLASLGLLGAGVAHQIKNPLGGILLSAESLKDKCGQCGKNNGEVKKDIDNIIMSVDLANQTVMELLEFSKETHHDTRPVDIQKKIDKALKLIDYKTKGIEIIKKFKDESVIVNGDPQKLEQVFLNLIINSIQAMEGKGKLTIQTDEKNDFYEIKFSDTGSGVPEKNLGKIFDPFFTTKEVGVGTGLGLSVALGIVERHNGYIQVDSKQEEGATFTVGLPKSGD